ncbi:HAD-IIA family hydrolase [Rhodovulum sp. DZ06]|uniref:HAD-IIA family hydrolase n=1 Tax=Rhodovulum sp. DZ06 TaxID=3425126 RepID=UPI003D32F722
MTRYTAAIFDIDGTLAMMDKATGTYEALPGAIEAMEACRARGMEVIAYTNGTFFPPAHYDPRLADAGIMVEAGKLLTPAVVGAARMAAMGIKRAMVLGGDGTAVPMQDAGIEVVAPTAENAKDVEAVMLGYTSDFGAAELEAVVQAVWAGAKPFAGSVAPYFAGAGGRLLGISGAIAAALENATEVPVTVFGKPEAAGLEMAAEMTGAAFADMIVIGDDPKLEIVMARRAGAFAIGVTTGIRDEAAFNAAPEGDRANVVIPTLENFGAQPWME